jgi:Na+/H+ antiporter NhaD/arsenite permease-like protein
LIRKALAEDMRVAMRLIKLGGSFVAKHKLTMTFAFALNLVLVTVLIGVCLGWRVPIKQTAAAFIFILTYALILSEKVHRTIVGIAGAVAMVACGLALGFYSQEDALNSIDFNTLGLLLGMMILATMLTKTGFFGYLATLGAKRTQGNPWRLMLILGTITTVLSMMVDNVTTIVLMAPLTIIIADIVGISPTPLLLAEALLSNTGGVATLVGDPPNIMIGSAANLSFTDFLVHLAPIVLVAWLVCLLLLRLLFKKELAERPQRVEELAQLDEREALTDPQALKKILIAFGIVLALFFVHHRFHLLPSFATMLGAAIALIWVRPNLDDILTEVEWGVLLFFTSLFIIVGGVEKAGLLEPVAQAIGFTSGNWVVMSLIILWIGALGSAFLDNVPFTVVMIPVIQQLGSQGIDVEPLWWALALGVGFGGNGTPIGSTAGVLAVSLSDKTRHPITFKVWLRSGSVVMLTTCFVGSILLILLTWLFH